MKLFCIPHAGGSTIPYNAWKKHLHDHIEFIPLDLPGHMPRFREPLCDNVEDIVNDLVQSVKNSLHPDETYALYGHSMGGMLLYFLYFRLLEEGYEPPAHLFFSSRWPPYHHNEKAQYDLENEKESKRRFLGMGGFNEIILNNPSMLDYHMNVLLTDFRLIQSVGTSSLRTIYSDITVLWSDKEPDIEDEDIYKWKLSAGKSIAFVKMKGSHFFPTEEPLKTANVINVTLRKYKESGVMP
ncbi:thioesterase II family protein [Paenibacillus vandeheii]